VCFENLSLISPHQYVCALFIPNTTEAAGWEGRRGPLNKTELDGALWSRIPFILDLIFVERRQQDSSKAGNIPAGLLRSETRPPPLHPPYIFTHIHSHTHTHTQFTSVETNLQPRYFLYGSWVGLGTENRCQYVSPCRAHQRSGWATWGERSPWIRGDRWWQEQP